MSLTASGQISMSDIRTELGDSGSISLKEASDGTIATINTQNDSADRPDGNAPHAMTEFYKYLTVVVVQVAQYLLLVDHLVHLH